MIRERKRLLLSGTLLLDLSALLLALLVAYWVRDAVLPRLLPAAFPERLFPLRSYVWMYAVLLPAWVALFFAFRLYSSRRLASFRRLPADLIRANLVGLALIIGTAYLLKLHDISRVFLILFGLASLLLIAGERLALRSLVRGFRRRGRALRRLIVVGTGDEARRIARLIRRRAEWGLTLLGMVDDGSGNRMPDGEDLAVVGELEDLESILAEQVVDEVLFVSPHRPMADFEEAFLLCEDLGINARLAVGGFPHVIAKARMEDFRGRVLLTFSTQPTSTAALALKRVLDLAAGSLLLALLLVPGLLMALLIKLDSRGPVFFVQERIGLHGRRFRMLKFRSMVAGAERLRRDLGPRNEMDGPVFKMRSDPRITMVGRFLRRTSLDELPQLLNVLRGDMALVGPRPPLPEEVAGYRRWQRRRLSMKPGITCLWQVSGRNRVDFEEWMRLDLKYIDTWSLWLDLKILLRTIPAVLSGRGAS